MKIIDEDAGIERDEALRGMIFKLTNNEQTWGKFKKDSLFLSDKFLRTLFEMPRYNNFWEEK